MFMANIQSGTSKDQATEPEFVCMMFLLHPCYDLLWKFLFWTYWEILSHLVCILYSSLYLSLTAYEEQRTVNGEHFDADFCEQRDVNEEVSGKQCRFNLTTLGPCYGPEKNYGYTKEEVCIFVRMNKVGTLSTAVALIYHTVDQWQVSIVGNQPNAILRYVEVNQKVQRIFLCSILPVYIM